MLPDCTGGGSRIHRGGRTPGVSASESSSSSRAHSAATLATDQPRSPAPLDLLGLVPHRQTADQPFAPPAPVAGLAQQPSGLSPPLASRLAFFAPNSPWASSLTHVGRNAANTDPLRTPVARFSPLYQRLLLAHGKKALDARLLVRSGRLDVARDRCSTSGKMCSGFKRWRGQPLCGHKRQEEGAGGPTASECPA